MVGEYNNFLDGTYDTRTISRRGADAFLHIRDQGVPGGVAWMPPSRPAAPSPAPATPKAAATHPSSGASGPAPPLPKPTSPAPAPSPTPVSRPAPVPAGPDPKVLAAGALSGLGASYVAFDPDRFMRPGASRLVEARVGRPDSLAAALNQHLTGSAAPPLRPDDLLAATLESPDFRIAATTPAQQ